jgi:glyoxylate/hydroxypyruvate reductase A
MPNILLAIQGWDDTGAWLARFRDLAGSKHDVRLWPDIGDPGEVDYACVWKQPPGLLATLPKLKAIFSLGAGVDHLLQDAQLPDLPIARIVDPDLTIRMVGYVVMHALLHQRQMKLYEQQQVERVWHEHYEPPPRLIRVGIMGMGVMGQASLRGLQAAGFSVIGWSRSKKTFDGVEMFDGEAGLKTFLGKTNILVCLLPLTPATKGILNYVLFKQLAREPIAPVLINAGRGGEQVESDILRALDDGTLGGASLDVFEQEPLAASNAFWNHPKVYVTPHNASASDPRALVANILSQIDNLERGGKLENLVDRKLGY